MYIGLGIFLLVVGAILAFAVHASLAGIDIAVVGWILMAGGLLAIVLSLVLTRRRGYAARRVSGRDPATGATVDEVHVDPEA